MLQVAQNNISPASHFTCFLFAAVAPHNSGTVIALKSCFCSAFGGLIEKVLYRLHCILLLYCKLPQAIELYNLTSSN